MIRRYPLILLALCLAAPLSAQDEEPALYAVGALGASNLYNAYFLLGTLADGFATDAYSPAFTDELARDVIGLSESATEVLGEILSAGSLSASDRTLVTDMIAAHELLINQAWGLIAYVEDRTDTDAWFRYRRQSWEAIRALLDLD